MQYRKPKEDMTLSVRKLHVQENGFVEILLVCRKTCRFPVQGHKKSFAISLIPHQKKKCAPTPRKRKRTDQKDRFQLTTFDWCLIATMAVITLLAA